jgi:folate-binding protein YgfZ
MTRYFAPLDASVIRVSGSDAKNYLQGQCTADLTKSNSCHALWLNRKGRVLAHTLIRQESNQDYLIVCPHLIASEAISIMSANLIADDVTMSDETSQWNVGIVWGDGKPRLDSNTRIWPSVRTSFESWVVLFSSENQISAEKSHLATIEKNRIESGIPSVPEDCAINEFPQECGLDDWVSYTKGCYLGQEVMARIQSMGSLRRSLRKISANQKLMSGAELKSPDSQKTIGTIKSCVGNIGLALVSVDYSEGSILDSSLGLIKVGELAKLPQYKEV